MLKADECQRRIERGGWNEERVLGRCEVPIGPRNTYSNLAYILAGFAIFLTQTGPESILMCGALVLLGIGSWAYHAHKTYGTNVMDRIGMLLVAGCLVGMAYVPIGQPPELPMVAISLAFVLLFATVAKRMDISYPMGFVLVSVSVPTLTGGPPDAKRWAAVALLSFMFAYAAWHVDKSQKTKWLWGHAVWHLLTAQAIALMYVALTLTRRG